jgi:hypothetical protein
MKLGPKAYINKDKTMIKVTLFNGQELFLRLLKDGWKPYVVHKAKEGK